MEKLVKIGEAAEQLGLHPATLREWERQGRIPKALRTATGQRVYSEQELIGIQRVMLGGKEA